MKPTLTFGLLFVTIATVCGGDAEYRKAQTVAQNVVAALRVKQTEQSTSQVSNYTAILENAAVEYPNNALIEYGLGYNGRTAEAWFEDRTESTNNPVPGLGNFRSRSPRGSPDSLPSVIAFRAMGTNAIPFLTGKMIL
jgi:hypothetical protein